MSWKLFFQNPKNKTEFLFTIILLIALMISFSQFLLFIEDREGVVLNDPILNLFNPINLTWLTFSLIYISLILFLFSYKNDPLKIMITLQAYGLMIIFRIITMYLTPFDPPENMLLLNDPFVQFFGKGDILTKDLFFSGHTGTLFLLFLLTDKKNLKIIFLTASIVVGLAVLIQHVHYTIDVFIAPFVAYTSYRIIKIFHENKNAGHQ